MTTYQRPADWAVAIKQRHFQGTLFDSMVKAVQLPSPMIERKPRSSTVTLYSAMQRYRTAGLTLMWHYNDREPQRLSHKTRLLRAVAEMEEAVAEVRVVLKEWTA